MKAFGKGAVAAAAALSLVMTGCMGQAKNGNSATKQTGKTAQAQWNPQPRENIKDGGSFTTAIGEITPNMNSWAASMTTDTATIWNWYNPMMTYFTPEGEFKVDKNYLVDMPTVSKDGAYKVTYHLHPNAKYNNGDPIDWKSFEAAWKACGEVTPDDYECNSTDGYKEIKSVTKGKDDKEVIVEFKAPYVWWQGLFSNLLNPNALPKDVFAEGYTNGNYHPEWGAGPFKIESINPDTKVATFVANDKWWGDKPKLEKRVFKVMESTASINAFKNQEIDATAVGNAERLKQVEGMQGIDIRRGASTSNALLTLNSEREQLKDIKVREAIFRSINRKAIAQIAFEGMNYTEELPGSFLLFGFQKGYVDNAGSLMSYDPEKSKKLLEEAGWKVGADGFREKDGKKLQVRIPVFGDSTTNKNRIQAIINFLKQVGIEGIFDQRASSDFSKVMKSRDFDMVFSGFSSGDPFGVAYICQIYCSDSTLNKSKTGEASYDQTIKDIAKMDDGEKQIAEGNKVEQKALATYGMMPVYNGPTVIAVKSGLANFGAAVFGGSSACPIQDIGWQK